MTKHLYILVFIALFHLLFSCESDDNDLENDLNRQFDLIISIAESESCSDSSEWRIVGLGAKPCGGPSGYMAYSINIDVETFLELVERYNEDVRKLNERNGLISDCAIEPAPFGVQCQDGMPVLIYSSCDLEPAPGPCFAAFRRYYFDKEEQKCKEFIWGGCNGTVPFETMEACRECERD